MVASTQKQNSMASLLVTWLKKGETFCPTRWNFVIDERSLYTAATRNKLHFLLLHFLDCPECRRRLSKRFLTHIANMQLLLFANILLYESEKRKLSVFLKRKNVKAMCFKHADMEAGKHNATHYVGSDIDVLTEKKNLPLILSEYLHRGYQKKEEGISKEIQLVHPSNKFQIDLHFLIAFPHNGELNAYEYEMVTRFTRDFLRFARMRRDGFAYAPPEYHFLSMILRFWYNDMVLGLKGLYDIGMFYVNNHKTTDWERFFVLADTYGLKKKIQFVLATSSMIFNFPLPRTVAKTLPLQVKVLIHGVTSDDIALFPPVSRWQKKSNAQTVQKKYLAYSLLTLLLSEKVSLRRLMRPKILRFVSRAWIAYIRSVFHLYAYTR